MRKLSVLTIVSLLCFAGSAFAVGYSNDFEVEPVGSLPVGWYLLTPWGDWAPGPITASVQAAPGGGQALEVVWGTDWTNYGASSGETGYTLDTTGYKGGPAVLKVEYDFWKENWRVWQVFGDQSWFPPGGIHMNDNPAGPNEMYVGRDGPAPPDLADVPESAWVHVSGVYNDSTGLWQTSVTYAGGSGGGVFGGTYATPNTIVGEYYFGGWAFKSTMDAAPVPPGGEYDNVLYIDNFSLSVVPEPGTISLVGAGLIGLLALRRRK